MRTRIHIDDLRVSCLIGCYPSERERTQEINVLIELDVDAREAAYEDSLAHTIDYMAIERSVRFVLQAGAFRLLETAGHSLVRTLLAPALDGPIPIAATVGDHWCDVRSGLSSGSNVEHGAFRVVPNGAAKLGSIHVLFENRQVGLYRLNVSPGQDPTHSVESPAWAVVGRGGWPGRLGPRGAHRCHGTRCHSILGPRNTCLLAQCGR